jgi:hypothetical protein
MAKKESELYLGGGYVNVKTAQTVETRNLLKLKTADEKFETLEVKIIADFSTIPEKYHEVFLNIFSSKYLDSVSFGDNPFSQCLPPPKKKWWQFWKANISI